MAELCTCNDGCPYTKLIKKGQGDVQGQAMCQNTMLCPPCALLDARLDMREHIREPRNFAFLLQVALPVARIVAAVDDQKEKVHELFSELLDVRGRRFYDLVNLGKVQSIAPGMRDVLPKKVTGFWKAFGQLGGRMNQVTEETGIQLLFIIWKSRIENYFKNDDDDGYWSQWKQSMKTTESNDVERALENAGVKKQFIKLWTIENLI